MVDPSYRANDVDRPVGVLNARMRKYLLEREDSEIDVGEKTQAERNIRGAIRRRIANSLMDFKLLTEHLDSGDLTQLFGFKQGIEDPVNVAETGRIHDAVEGTIGFLYRLAKEQNQSFEEWLQWSIAGMETGPYFGTSEAGDPLLFLERPNVSFNVDEAETINLKLLRQKLESGKWENLSDPELFVLFLVARDGRMDNLNSDEWPELTHPQEGVAEWIEDFWDRLDPSSDGEE